MRIEQLLEDETGRKTITSRSSDSSQAKIKKKKKPEESMVSFLLVNVRDLFEKTTHGLDFHINGVVGGNLHTTINGQEYHHAPPSDMSPEEFYRKAKKIHTFSPGKSLAWVNKSQTAARKM
jgi:hypothetical protein